MNQQQSTTINIERSDAHNGSETRLHGRWLLLARTAWVTIAVCTLALFVISLSAYYARLQIACFGAAACQLDGALTPAGIRTLQATGFSLSGYATYTVIEVIVVILIWSAVGLIIFWRRSDDWMALLVALMLVLFNAGQQDIAPTALTMTQPAWTIPVEAVNFLSELFFGLVLYLFPNGRFAPRWMRWFALYYALIIALEIFPPAASPLNVNFWPDWVRGLLFLLIFLSVIFTQIYRYRRLSNPIQRQQTKWVVFGIVISLIGVIGLNLAYGIFSSLNRPGSLFELVVNTVVPLILLPIPFSIAIAILRYRLWDIDTIINKALVYGTLTVSLALVYVGLVLGLQALLGGLLHQTNAIVLVVSTLVIAALAQTLRRRIQQLIDRRFYRRKYDAARTIAVFSATLRSEVDLNELREHLLAVVQETMQPAHVSLWLRPPEHDRTQRVPWRSNPPASSDGK